MLKSKVGKVEAVVLENLEVLTSSTYKEIVAFGSARFNSRAGFAAYKKALTKHGIDYDQLQQDHRAGREADRVAGFVGAADVILFSDAKARTNRFSICDGRGEEVWFGNFFGTEGGGEQSACELAAAKKAVWFSKKLSERLERPVRLHLRVDADYLLWANDRTGRGGVAQELRREADRLGVDLIVYHVPGAENPADEKTCAGRDYKKWAEGLDEILGREYCVASPQAIADLNPEEEDEPETVGQTSGPAKNVPAAAAEMVAEVRTTGQLTLW